MSKKNLFERIKNRVKPERKPGPGEIACPFCGRVGEERQIRDHAIRQHNFH